MKLLTADEAKALPFHYYRPVNTRDKFRMQPRHEGGICACMHAYKKCERLVSLPCGHRMHRKCATAWLVMVGGCPFCKKKARRMELMKKKK